MLNVLVVAFALLVGSMLKELIKELTKKEIKSLANVIRNNAYKTTVLLALGVIIALLVSNGTS